MYSKWVPIGVSNDEKALLFNQYFNSVFTKSHFPLPQFNDTSETPSRLDHITFSVSDVFTALCSLDPSMAMEIDGIGPKVLKYCAILIYANP